MIIELSQQHFWGVYCRARSSGVGRGFAVEENELEVVGASGESVLEGDHSLGIETTTHDFFCLQGSSTQL